MFRYQGCDISVDCESDGTVLAEAITTIRQTADEESAVKAGWVYAYTDLLDASGTTRFCLMDIDGDGSPELFVPRLNQTKTLHLFDYAKRRMPTDASNDIGVGSFDWDVAGTKFFKGNYPGTFGTFNDQSYNNTAPEDKFYSGHYTEYKYIGAKAQTVTVWSAYYDRDDKTGERIGGTEEYRHDGKPASKQEYDAAVSAFQKNYSELVWKTYRFAEDLENY